MVCSTGSKINQILPEGLFLIGDIHGRVDEYTGVVKRLGCRSSIQLGDLDISPYSYLRKVNPNHHIIIPGNHDHYSYVRKWPHFKQGFGEICHGGRKIFFISGAASIDREYRTPGFDWFPEEELSYTQLEAAVFAWEKSDAEIIVSHSAPARFSYTLYSDYKESQTEIALFEMWKIKIPKFWFFGHHHISHVWKFEHSHVQCVNCGEVLCLTPNNEVITVREKTHYIK